MKIIDLAGGLPEPVNRIISDACKITMLKETGYKAEPGEWHTRRRCPARRIVSGWYPM